MNNTNNLTMKLSLIIILLFIGITEQRSIAKHRLTIGSLDAKRIGMEAESLVHDAQQQRRLVPHNRKRRSIRQDKCTEITITECMNIEGTDKKFCNTYQSVEC